MNTIKEYEDPCETLTFNGKSQRAFRVGKNENENVLVCQVNKPTNTYKAVVLLDGRTQEPIVVNQKFLQQAKQAK